MRWVLLKWHDNEMSWAHVHGWIVMSWIWNVKRLALKVDILVISLHREYFLTVIIFWYVSVHNSLGSLGETFRVAL